MNEKEPKVSVIVPIYSVELYLRKCIDSIRKQTHRNLEIILVDDGSPDACGRICDQYAIRDSRILVVHKENGGVSSARNTGLDIAKGEYIAFVDADDTIHPQFIENLVELCVQYECDIAQCDYLAVAEDSLLLPLNPWREISYYNGRQALYELCKGGTNAIKYTVPWNRIYRKVLFEGIRYPIGKIHEDEFITYQVLWRARKIAITKQCLYYYLQRGTSITGRGFSLQRLDALDAVRERLDFLNKHGLEKEYFQALYGFTFLLEKNSDLLKKNIENCEEICSQLLREKDIIEKFISVNSQKIEKENISESLTDIIYPYGPMEKIILYGAGKWGQIYYKWIKENKLGILAGWIDNNWYNLRQEGLQVMPLDTLLKVSYDYVLVAVMNKSAQKEIIQNLVYWGIPKEKISVIPLQKEATWNS